MVNYPARGTPDWDDDLQQYIDGHHRNVQNSAVASAAAAEAARAAAVTAKDQTAAASAEVVLRRDQAVAAKNAAEAAAGTAASQAAAGVAAATAADRNAVATDRAFVEARTVDDLSTTDGQTKALIETPSSETARALTATIAAEAAALIASGRIVDMPYTPSPTTLNSTQEFITQANGLKRYAWMSFDGLRLYVYEFTSARRSTDDGLTNVAITPTFARKITLIRETQDGELLVCIDSGRAAGGAKGEVWKSSGYNFGAATSAHTTNIANWTKVLESNNGGAWFDQRWGHWVHENHVFLIEYGLKVAPNNARRAYHSHDHGKAGTWREIYSHPEVNPNDAHLHGIAYDKWWDRVWITVGDGLNRRVVFSDDWREAVPTWTTFRTGSPNMVTLFPMENCILLGSDDPPNGVGRIQRLGYRTAGAMESAHKINNVNSLTHVAGTMYRRSDNHPLLIAFAPSSVDRLPAVLVATMDGKAFYTVWVDPQGSYAGSYAAGLFTAVGPTASGKIVGDLRDDRASYTLFRANAPTWKGGGLTWQPPSI